MKVAEITRFGGPEVFRIAERPDPVPGPGQVVVRIMAASVNPTDLATREQPYTPGLELPLVLGWDLAGVVTAVGDEVGGYAPGDRVCGMIPFGRIAGRVGAYAEAAAVQPDWLAHLPGNVSFEEAATLPLNSLTAHQALAFFHLDPGARLLITGASGGVGGFATSLAVRAGLHVIAVAGRVGPQHAIYELRLTVAHDNTIGQRMYDRSGFRYADVAPGRYAGGQRAIRMVRPLP